eukprot:SAG31_NODE_45579_length_258_cov_0.654088_1_plen_30_part_10
MHNGRNDWRLSENCDSGNFKVNAIALYYLN